MHARRKAGRKTKTDAFVLAKLEADKLTPSPAADRRGAGDSRVPRSRRLPPDLRGDPGVLERSIRDCLRVVDRSSAGLAALRRAVGTPMDGCGAVRRGQPDLRSDQPAVSRSRGAIATGWSRRSTPTCRTTGSCSLQLGGRPDARRARANDLRALGYLGAAPVYHKDLRLSGRHHRQLLHRRLG